MNHFLIFFWIFLAMIATSFWESYIEGKNAWAKKQVGWKFKIGQFTLTAYHFWLFGITYPLLILLPLIIFGFNKHLLGVLISAYFLGLILEDFFYFLINPYFGFKKFNPRNASFYPWVSFGKLSIPLLYIFALLISFLSWLFLWK